MDSTRLAVTVNASYIVTMDDPALLSDPGKIDADWLTQVLEIAGFDGKVNHFTASSIGTGQVGENVRFRLDVQGNLPKTVVGKFPSTDPVSRQTGIDQLNYKKEIHFYHVLQPTLDIQTPRCFFSKIDPDTHDFVILMEDLAPGIQGDQIAGCGEEKAILAMTELARLHGPRWGDESLVVEGLIEAANEERAQNIKVLYDQVLPGFITRYEDRLTNGEIEIAKNVGDLLVPYSAGVSTELTLIHIDYRLDNMMFGGPYRMATVDWQSMAYGCGLNDAAYFVGTSVLEDQRANLDEKLLRAYFDELARYQVNLSWGACWRLYRHHSPAGLIMAVIASMIVGETERGNDMFMAMAKRSARMTEELDALSVISDQ